VWSVERHSDLAEFAQQRVGNATVVVGDGSEGLPEHAPYDAIIVAAAFPSVPEPLAQQLVQGGRLVQPIGPGGAEDVVLFERGAEGLERRHSVIAAHFVRLYGRYGFPAS
jgi:protein-L-isoaspartate(D-aspartate) O-methyltransferase